MEGKRLMACLGLPLAKRRSQDRLDTMEGEERGPGHLGPPLQVRHTRVYTKVATKVFTLRILKKVPPSIHLDLPQIIKKVI